jgi:hypothetical protein
VTIHTTSAAIATLATVEMEEAVVTVGVENKAGQEKQGVLNPIVK